MPDKALVDRAEAALRAAGRIPERRVLESLPATWLQEVIEYWSGPFYVA